MHAIKDHAGIFVADIAGQQDGPAEGCSKLTKRLFTYRNLSTQ